MGKILREYLREERDEFIELGLLYAPSSIYHGKPLRGTPLNLSDVAVLKVDVAQLNDFLEFLFEHSEHCDHIEQSEAWDEFYEWQFKQLNQPPQGE